MTKQIEKKWTLVKAHFEIEGVHQFPGVNEMLLQQLEQIPGENDPALNYLDVGFLAFPHRHIFKFDIKVDVFHDDRDIEFIQLGRYLKQSMLARYPAFDHGCSNFGAKSCEMLADEVKDIFLQIYPHYQGKIMIEVSEDGENSAISLWHVLDGPDFSNVN